MKAAVTAATSTDWVPKTVSTETGYLLAERDVRVMGRSGRSDSYKLEVMFQQMETGTSVQKLLPHQALWAAKAPIVWLQSFSTLTILLCVVKKMLSETFGGK
jgi:hypothetical protein